MENNELTRTPAGRVIIDTKFLSSIDIRINRAFPITRFFQEFSRVAA